MCGVSRPIVVYGMLCVDYYVRLVDQSRPVVPKLGAMAPQGAMGLLPGSHGRILNKYIYQGLILKYGLLEFLEFFTH